MIRTLMVDMPFSSAYRPNLALENLKAYLRINGYSCDIRYPKLEFAAQIGLERYTRIALKTSPKFLLGDFIFGAQLEKQSKTDSSVQTYCHALQDRYGDQVPSWFLDELSSLRDEAEIFLRRLSTEIIDEKYDLVGLNVTFNLSPSISLALSIKSAPNAPYIILGGNYCDGKPGETIHRGFPWIDFVAQGEGEELIAELVANLSNTPDPDDLSSIRGLIWRNDTHSVLNCERAHAFLKMDHIPTPDYSEWLQQVENAGLTISKSDTIITFESSRGCWYGMKTPCTFCGLNAKSRTFRSKSPERVLSDLREIELLGIQNAEAVDLVVDRNYFKCVFPQLSKKKKNLSLFYETKANITRNQVRILKEAGVANIQPGIESLSGSILRLMRKGVAPYHNIRLLKWCQEFGIKARWNFLCGFPGENHEDYISMANMIPYIMHLQPPMGNCSKVFMYRFSPLFDQYQNWGIQSKQPVPAYELIFGHYIPDISNLAYFFDYDYEKIDDGAYMEPLKRAVKKWRDRAGQEILIMYDRKKYIHVIDKRIITPNNRFQIEGEDRIVLTACDAGATMKTLSRTTGLPPSLIQNSLQRLTEFGILLELENHYLSLCVNANSWIPPETPDALIEPLCEIIATKRSRALMN